LSYGRILVSLRLRIITETDLFGRHPHQSLNHEIA